MTIKLGADPVGLAPIQAVRVGGCWVLNSTNPPAKGTRFVDRSGATFEVVGEPRRGGWFDVAARLREERTGREVDAYVAWKAQVAA